MVVVTWLVSVIFAALFGYMSASEHVHDRCVAMYADMPHNKVGEHCVTLLKFQKESK